MQETQVQSLGQEDPLEKEMATHTPVFLPGESHGQKSLVGYSPRGHKKPPSPREEKAAHTFLHSKEQLFLSVICVPFHERNWKSICVLVSERNSEPKCEWTPVRETHGSSWWFSFQLSIVSSVSWRKSFPFLRSSSWRLRLNLSGSLCTSSSQQPSVASNLCDLSCNTYYDWSLRNRSNGKNILAKPPPDS